MITDNLSQQVERVVAENQQLRIKSGNDDKTIHLLKEQYDALAATVDGLHDKYNRDIHRAQTERDQSVRKFREVDTVLMQAADLIMQALRAKQGSYGDSVITTAKESIQQPRPVSPNSPVVPRATGTVHDDRLPIARLS